MRRSLFVAAMLVLFGASALAPLGRTASAQVGFFGSATIEPSKETTASVEEVIGRVMSFDHDGDGAVGADELLDRMQPLMDRGDRDGNGRLDRAEVRALASAPPRSKNGVGFPFSGSYGFGDEIGFSSRSHVGGALGDLRLDGATLERALLVVSDFMDALEARASSELLEAVEPLLTRGQLSNFRDALERPQPAPVLTFRSQAEGGNPVVVFRGPPIPIERRIEQFRLAPAAQETALAAVERYRETTRPGDAERPVLLAALEGILDNEQRENFRAALERRPVVSTGLPFVVPPPPPVPEPVNLDRTGFRIRSVANVASGEGPAVVTQQER